MGLLVVMDTKPLQQGDDLQALLEVFAPRVAAEFERRRAEQERAQALVDLHNVIETIPDIVFALDTQGNVVKWNRRLEDVTGYSSEELLNKPALAFVPPEEQARTAAAIQRAFMEGYAELEGHLLTKEHHLIPYHWAGALLKNRHGEPVGITGIGRDASEKKRAEEELQRQQRHLVEAQTLAHLGSWYWDVDSSKAQWSDEQYRIFGHEPGSISVTYDTFLVALFPDDRDRVLSAISNALTGKVPYDIECRIVRPNGDVRFLHARAEVQRDVTGHPSSMAGTVLDITERKQAEEALQKSEKHFRAIFENAAFGIAFGSHTTGTGISQVNPAFQSMTGYNSEKLCRLGIMGLTYPGDLPVSKAFVERLVSGALTHGTIEKQYVKKDGSIMWAQTTVSSILDEQGDYEHSVTMIQDITTRKINEQLLAAQKRVLEMIATDAPLQEILTLMCQAVEELSPGVHCSILLLDRDGVHLRHGAAPSLPEVYAHAIDGVAIGPAVGSCGTAAFTRRQVIVSNIAEDPLWTDYRDLALRTGVPSLNETLELECLDGTKKTLRNSTVPVKNERGNIMGAVVLNEDITFLRVAQEALELTKLFVDCASRVSSGSGLMPGL